LPKIIETFPIFRLTYDSKGTPGEFRNSKGLKLFATLERPRNGNKRDNKKTKENESGCIPEGTYLCKKYSSEKFPNTWEITGVEGRNRILFHRANNIFDLLGCVGIGERFAFNVAHPITKVNCKYWLLESKIAFERFQKIMPNEFYLRINSQESEDLCRLPSS
jgi:hypothetical protein